MANVQMKQIASSLSHYYPNAEDMENIIVNYALVAASADMVSGIIPGLAVPATIISCFGAVWVMYGKLCNEMGITLKENVLKLLARAALTNIVANLGGVIAGMLVGMLIPGASILASALTVFITVYLAGQIFLELILKLAQKSKDPLTFSDISASEMKREVKNTKVSADDLNAAKSVY